MSNATRSRVRDSRGRPVQGIYKKNDNYIAGFNCPTSGKWRMQALTAKDLSAAKRERESLLAGLREGRVAARNDASVQAVFLDWQSSRRISPRTARNEKSLFSRHLGAISAKRAQDVTATEVAALLKMPGFSEWTRTGVYRMARGLFAHAVRRGLATRNPVDGLGRAKRPTQKNLKEIRVLDAVEVEKLLDAASTPRWRAALALMALAGLRLGEMRALTWGDVGDLSLRVSKSAHKGEIKEPKTQAGVRDVPLSPLLHRTLAAWRLQSPRSLNEHLVVGTCRGRPVGETAVRNALASAAAKAGLLEGEERLSPHSLRHSYASRLGLGGLNPTTLARILGHTDASFTLKTYCSDQRGIDDVAADVLRASAV